jgi:hypothetical protein
MRPCLAVSFALALALRPASAQVVINRFDTDMEASQWRFDFGGVANRAWEFDPTMDADGNPASGALKFTLTFDTALGGNNQIAFTRDIFPAINGNQFERLQMDVRVDPSSPVGTSGAYGLFQLVIRNTASYSYNALFEVPVVMSDQWIHFEPVLTGPVDAIRGITWKIWGGGGQNLNGIYTLWIDNVVLIPPRVVEPPLLTLAPVTPGLEIYASLGDRFQRQDIRTASTDYSWLAPGVGPVTYALTIANFPDATFNAFETRLLLVGNNPSPGSYGDYNEANVVYLRILENPIASGYEGELRYKVNAPGASIFDGTLVARLSTATILGTWGLTLDGLNATLFAPDGTSASGAFGDNVLTAFEQAACVYVGLVPNEAANVGQSVVFSGVSVTGANADLVEDFRTLDNWVTGVAQDPGGVVLVPVGAIRKLLWPASAVGFTLHSVTELMAEPTWPLSDLTVKTVGTNKLAVLGPDSGNRFFRLEGPAAARQ